MSQRVTLDDIETKLRGLAGSAQSSVSARASTPPAVAVGAAGALVAVAAVYLLGRRRGRKAAPVLEIRRI
jgi:membrane protein DedA with SNARE-associated domain